jgi:hypothetical protein
MKLGREDLSSFERVLILMLLDCLRSSDGKGREIIIEGVEYYWEKLPDHEKSDVKGSSARTSDNQGKPNSGY